MSSLPRGKYVYSAVFSVTPNPIDKTFKVKFIVRLTRNQLIEAYIPVKGIKQISDMVKRYEQEGWRPEEEKEADDERHYRTNP